MRTDICGGFKRQPREQKDLARAFSSLRRRAGCRVSSWIKRRRSSRPARRSSLQTGRWIRRRRVTLISKLSLRRKINFLDQLNNGRATRIGVATPVLGPVLRPNRTAQGTKGNVTRDEKKLREMRTNACEQRSRLHLQLRMHILRRLRRGTELRLSKLRRRAGAAAARQGVD